MPVFHMRGACLAAILLALTAGNAAADPQLEQTEVFVSGAEGYHTFRIPAAVATTKGTLLAFCEGRKTGPGDHGDIDLVLKRSTDNGRTWGRLQLVHEEGDTAKITIGNPAPVVDADTGTVWLLFTRDNTDVFVTSSADDGATWSKPRKITAGVKRDDWTWYATGPGNGIQIQLTRGPKRGRLVIPCDNRVGEGKLAENAFSHVIYSDDHGKTWQLGGIVPDHGMNECAVVELKDGSLMLNMRSYRGLNRRAVSISKDGGETWSKATDDPTLIEPVCQASLIRRNWPDGNEPGRLLFSNPADKKRVRMTVRLSEDDGQTWPISRVLHEGPSAYSNLVALPDGQSGCLYERGQKNASERISFARFPVEWLRGGDTTSP